MPIHNSWTVRQRIYILCLALVAISAAIGIVSAVSINKLLGSLNRVATVSLPSIKQMAAIQALGLEFRGTSLLMGTPGLRNVYRNKQTAHLKELRAEILARVASYGNSVPAEERSTYRTLQSTTNVFLKTVDHFVELSLSGRAEEAGAFWSVAGGAQSKAFRKALEDEIAINEQFNSGYVEAGVSAARWATRLSWTLLVLSVTVGALLGTLIARGIARALRAAADDLGATVETVSGAASELLSAGNELVDNALQQAQALEQTSSSSAEVAAASYRNAESCESASAVMLHTESVVNAANLKLNETVVSMQEITDSSHRIASIIKVIDGISFQTNILALNAAVEAARAGEAGAGFAVVADEVRSLAARSARAAEDITTSIYESVQNAQVGKRRLDDAAISVRALAGSALQVTALIAKVHGDTRQQTVSIDQITTALRHIESWTQQTTAMAEKHASSSAQLNLQANSMQEIVSTLSSLI